MQQSHRSGNFKQSNKTHKSKHRSKREIVSALKGKASQKEVVRRSKHELKREERRHQALQIRRNKREDALAKKRSLGSSRNPPFLVCIIALNETIDVKSALSILNTCTENVILSESENGITHLVLPNFKQRFSFVCPETGNDFATIDALKIADTVLFITSAVDEPIDEWGERVMALTLGQGMPTPIVCLMDIESINPKKRTLEKQNIQKLITKWLPEEKIMLLDKNSDAMNVLRRIGNQKRKVLHHRERRAYIYSEKVEYLKDVDKETGTLKVSGYLRGMPLNVNGLVHISGLGDFQISQIDLPDDPHPLTSTKNENAMEDGMIQVIKADPAKQESLDSENVPDTMDADQIWPTDEEIHLAQNEEKKKKVKVPKGMSDYQAAWIVDSDQDEESSQSSDQSDDEQMSAQENEDQFPENEDEEFVSADEGNEEGSCDEEDESEGVLPSDKKYDQDFDRDEELEALKESKRARENIQFPDEVDTPQDIAARDRFQRYRALESFRSSAWDPKENLPADFARIFQFENYDRTRKRIFKNIEKNVQDMVGSYVTVHVKEVPHLQWSGFCSSTGQKPTLALFGILPHEHKMSVVNVVLKRTGASEEPIKSKERLIMQVGYRRFIVNPVFSQHTNGNKHKYERYFQPASSIVATFYAPIQFSPSSVLCFKEKRNSDLQLIASGVLLSCNPDRMIIKRAILSGHPFKVNKRSAVIRFMFFNREDVMYFKPCKLKTKLGRTGHIKEPLGTHGHMKCVFDGQLKSQDTVLLHLYKRVFPKWTYQNCIASVASNDIASMEE